MKQIASLTLALVMVAALFTGCGCAANVSTHPGGMITEDAATRPSIMPTPTATHETTRPMETTHATMPTVTGSDPTDASSNPTDTTRPATSPTDTIGESTTPTDSTMDARHRNRNINR